MKNKLTTIFVLFSALILAMGTTVFASKQEQSLKDGS
jgi:hypothetical protein